MAMTMFDQGAVRHILLDNESARNAITGDDVVAIHASISNLSPLIRAVVFKGAGRTFSSGMHLTTFAGLDEHGARMMISALGEMIGAVRRLEIATLAVIDGPCMGAALELAAACDLRIGTPETTVGMPEVRLGFPSVLDAALLHQYFGLSLTKEMLLTGRAMPLKEWSATSFLNRVVTADRLQAECASMLEGLLQLPAAAYGAQKRLLNMWQNEPLDAAVRLSVDEFAASFAASTA
jgi:enoyl-CoA hydratase